ncbi:MAG: tetratricopeptide repeat protein [Candidatus Cloacimonetes bacterium]|nr:tetratricopeptide repeat protein [Candidatus Cloacimonadota bacterium]
MKKLITIIGLILVMLPALISAGEYDDLLFAAGLYGDGNLSLAQQELENYLVKSPQSKFLPEARFLLGTIYLETENYQEAGKIFELLHSEPPSSIAYSEILAGLASSYYGRGAAGKAKVLLEELLGKYPGFKQKGEMQHLLGKCYLAEGESDEAIIWLQKALLSSDTAVVRQELISVLLQEDRISEAREILVQALEKFPDEEPVNYALVLYQQQNISRQNYQEVLTLGYASIQQSSLYFEQYSLLVAIAYFETGNYEQSALWLKDQNTPKAKYYRALNYIQTENREEARTILAELYAHSSGEIKANSLFYLATLQESEQRKLELLEEFIGNNTSNEFIAEAYFQSGLASYNLKKYAQSQASLQQSLSKGITGNAKEKAEYLIAEAYYQQQDFEKAKKSLLAFKESYPGSSFCDEAYFKLALSYFYLKEYDRAEENFQIITYNYQQSSKLGMSNFYLGEIKLLSGDNEKARQYYAAALNQDTDKEMVWLRIARSWFKDKDMKKAAAALENVQQESPNYSEKILLMGDIHFAEKDYDKAIAAYNKAIEKETAPAQKDEIIARKAWTYYQKGDYTQASNIYNQLSIRTDNPAAYTFQSATALFSAQQYSQALQQYQTFVQNFPTSPDYMSAMVGIADCYYNLQDFQNARLQYRKLLTIITKEDLYNSILDGWKWSTEQSKGDFRNEISDFLKGEIPYNFRFLVSGYEAKYLYSLGDYEECINIIDVLKHEYNYPMKELEYMRGRCLVKLERWDEADDFYSRLFIIYKDPDLQYEWADVTLELGNIDTTVRKLQYAAEKRQKADYILKLLELELNYDREEFSVDYDKLLPYLSGVSKEKAVTLRVKWLLKNREFTTATSLIEILQKSETREIQAEGQYLKGYSQYEQGNFEAAIPELLRVRHLFPYLPEVRQKAEEIAFYAYLKAGKTKEAQNLLENIRNELPAEKAAALDKMLTGK